MSEVSKDPGRVPMPGDLGVPPSKGKGPLDVATRWYGVGTLLSLDVVGGYFDWMGLDVSPDPVVTAVRQTMREIDAAKVEDPQAAYAYTERVPAAIREALPPADAHRALRWAQRTYLDDGFADQAAWCTYLAAFHHVASHGPGDSPKLPLSWWKRLAGTFASLVGDMGEVENKMQQSYGEPLSDEDLRTYVEHGYTPDDSGANPLDKVFFIIELHRFQEFATRASSGLGTAEHQALRHDVIVIRRRGDHPIPSDLPRLDELVQSLKEDGP